MNIILQGPQACGKGTQARLLSEKFGLLHFEMGKILRSIANSNNEHAPIVKETLNSGNLVPDEYVRLIAWDFINKHHEKGIVFEGYPRSLIQFEYLEDMLKKFNKRIDALISLALPETESMKRMGARRTCVRCGRVYNLISDPPPYDNKCECGGDLILREDDKPEALKRRLEIYASQSRPIFELASKQGIAIEIDGNQPITKVFADIVNKICPK